MLFTCTQESSPTTFHKKVSTRQVIDSSIIYVSIDRLIINNISTYIDTTIRNNRDTMNKMHIVFPSSILFSHYVGLMF
jgi:hypothetical protein